MVKLLTAIGLSLILCSTAALATPKAKTDGKQQGTEAKYCLTFEDTGSHLSRTECRTKKEWEKRGVNLDELSSKDARSEGDA